MTYWKAKPQPSKSPCRLCYAKPSEQVAFIKDLQTLIEADEKTAVIKFDEFSVCQKPSSYYGWAEKNTRPKFVTNEKNEIEPMDY